MVDLYKHVVLEMLPKMQRICIGVRSMAGWRCSPGHFLVPLAYRRQVRFQAVGMLIILICPLWFLS